MSRCYPYPPPGYTLSRARNESLIESIKLQKEKERKKEKKEKRKEKKEKRKEKKEERRERKEERKDETNQSLDKSDIPKHLISHRSLSYEKAKKIVHKQRETEIEQLEQSSVTEEHARPSSLSVPSTSSDSTQNNNKRKRHSSPDHGKVILLRLPSKKQNEFDADLAKEQQSCLRSGRSNSHAKSGDANCVRDGPANGTNNIGHGLNLGNNRREHKGLTSQKTEGKTDIKPMPDVISTSMHKMELQYQNLLEDCFHTQIQDACLYSDDLNWLFQGRNQEARAEKKQRFGSESLCCSRSISGLLWPRAEYLREVDIYALPFTVPY